MDPQPVPASTGKLEFSGISLTDVAVIPLDNTDSQAVIAGTDRLIFRNNFIYNFDLRKEKSIAIFDRKGRFVKKIQKQGGAEDEYQSIKDARINTLNGDIELLCNMGTKLIIYDSLGNYKSYYRMTECPGPKFFYHIGGSIYLYEQFLACGDKLMKRGTGYRLVKRSLANPEGPGEKFLPYNFSVTVPDAALNFDAFSACSWSADTALLYENFNDTVYHVTAGAVGYRYVVRFTGEKQKPDNLLTDDAISNITGHLRANKLSRVIRFLENETHISIFYGYYNWKEQLTTVNNAFYDKGSGRTTVFRNDRLLAKAGDTPFYFSNYLVPAFLDDSGRFVSMIGADDLSLLLTLKAENNSSFFKKSGLQQVKAGGNPVLICYTINALNQ